MLNEIIRNALNNPDCSILTGMLIGNVMSIKNALIIFVTYYMFKLFDNTCIKPSINYIKKKMN